MPANWRMFSPNEMLGIIMLGADIQCNAPLTPAPANSPRAADKDKLGADAQLTSL